jgi:formylglycine-generating enzyme required for sulfatase activity
MKTKKTVLKKAFPITVVIMIAVLTPLGAQAFRNEVLVEGGKFMMGSNVSSWRPIHEIYLSSFWIMKTEVTQAEWTAIMGSNPSNFIGDKAPVEHVSWFEALEFANALSRKDGLQIVYHMNKGDGTCDFGKNGWRLPTEAEWEYAAMGGKESEGYFYSGSNSLDGVGWYLGNSAYTSQSPLQSHSVGTKRPNELGIFDMSGNVQEWCWDWHDREYYSKSPLMNPSGPAMGTLRILRGGSFFSRAIEAEVSFRSTCKPTFKSSQIGFRLVRNQY